MRHPDDHVNIRHVSYNGVRRRKHVKFFLETQLSNGDCQSVSIRIVNTRGTEATDDDDVHTVEFDTCIPNSCIGSGFIRSESILEALEANDNCDNASHNPTALLDTVQRYMASFLAKGISLEIERRPVNDESEDVLGIILTSGKTVAVAELDFDDATPFFRATEKPGSAIIGDPHSEDGFDADDGTETPLRAVQD